ncbi:MAG TPA: transposase [Firmicutes bacterium]|jgi:hypothetical protein|nr:CD1871A family CXXC motif-containing protein [Gelria sp. Kuro-4]MDI3523014.1 hypothetical protein [Bacillota bacterium]MDK2927000.1 hypothetical protein [Bacillota bacterium]BCV24621.1 hypothetical protein kuro4_13940 [Gelria sp. Kuro-4]HHV58221.1 transposase [Bacillota bacterium]
MFRRNRLGLALLTAGVVLVALGLLRGEAEAVFEKAASLCLECIGIG